MLSHSPLLHLTSLLRQRHARPPGFNLFTTLRGASDEVRLHSRFISALLEPNSHSLERAPLREFLSICEIRNFDMEGVRVECERWNIDILVTNTKRQALLIENKIYANDQPEQLVRYYRRLLEAGYNDIHIRYLSLDSRTPQEDSLGELRSVNKGSYANIDYYSDIFPWLNTCLGLSALDAPLRESLAQYRDLILKLTGNDMDSHHLETLAETLLQGDNLLSAHDIRLAYDEALVRLQAKFWRSLRARIEEHHQTIAEHLIVEESWTEENLDGYCRAYAERRRNSKYFGLYYKIPGHPDSVSAGIEIENEIYFGIYCEKENNPDNYHALCKQLDNAGCSSSRNIYWPTYSYPTRGINFRSPNADQISQLSDPNRFEALIAEIADELAALWRICCNKKT